MDVTTAQRIKTAMNIRDITQAELSEKTGISKGALSSYISGRYKPKQTNTYLIAKALNVSEAWLLGADVEMDARANVELSTAVPAYGKYRIPIVATVAAGIPLFSEGNIEGYVDWYKDTNDVFACRIKGNSMEPRIYDGDMIIVDKEAAWDDGDIVLVTVNGNEGTCKRIKKYDNSIALLSLNHSYDPMIYSSKQVEELPVVVQGKVIEYRGKL